MRHIKWDLMIVAILGALTGLIFTMGLVVIGLLKESAATLQTIMLEMGR